MRIGFGCPGSHHFVLRQSDKRINVAERFTLDGDMTPKADISLHKWGLIKDALQSEFNRRLKPTGRFGKEETIVEQLLGKELLVLVWAIEDCDPSLIPVSIRNWAGLAPEERWWLYTMTNALTGNVDDRRGWRKALRYALSENL